MNPQAIIEKIRKDRILQIILGLSLFFFIVFVIRPIFFSKKTPQAPCYQATLKIWSPFKEENFSSLVSNLSKYCLSFEFQEKSLEAIKKDLVYALATEEFPDIVYVDNSYLIKNQNFFATATPINIDSLVAYYNKDILNFFQIEKPKTIDDFKIFIQKIKDLKRENFYPVGLGTKEIRNRKEIILTLMTMNENYQEKTNFRQNFSSTLEFYHSFQDPQSEFFAYAQNLGDDLINFAQEKLAMFIGFYKDKKEILSLNPRLNYEISFLPNTFPPKMKIYSQIFYLAPIKKSKNLKASLDFLDYFSKYKLKEFSEIFDLVPGKEELISQEDKKIVLNSAKNFGETFDFFNKEVIFENLDKILDLWENKNEVRNIIEAIIYSL